MREPQGHAEAGIREEAQGLPQPPSPRPRARDSARNQPGRRGPAQTHSRRGPCRREAGLVRWAECRLFLAAGDILTAVTGPASRATVTQDHAVRRTVTTTSLGDARGRPSTRGPRSPLRRPRSRGPACEASEPWGTRPHFRRATGRCVDDGRADRDASCDGSEVSGRVPRGPRGCRHGPGGHRDGRLCGSGPFALLMSVLKPVFPCRVKGRLLKYI